MIVEAPSSQGIEILENVTLPCRVTGIPTPKVMWRHASGNVQLGGRFTQLKTGALHISGRWIEEIFVSNVFFCINL